MKTSALYFSLLVCMLSTCSALQCYVCNSHYHKSCAHSPVPKEFLVDCTLDNKQPLPAKEGEKVPVGTRTKRDTLDGPGHLMAVTIGSPTEKKNFTMCRKLTITIPDQENGNLPIKAGHTRVFRSCGWSPDPSTAGESGGGCRYGTGEGIQNYMCACTKDGCNAAGNLNVSKIFILFAFISSCFVGAIK